MGRPKRAAQAGYIYHVLNRANARMTIFETDDDYAAFVRILSEAVERFEMRLLSFYVTDRKRGQDSFLLSFSLVSARLGTCLEPNEFVLPVRCFMC
ncbi:hypothetical protein Pan241w_41260 [Gimesia alba]|uniref:Transposase IS200 like protein n=1 Tax=Gimesia alba TaxID=2527973 RepID=A0A517RJG8_9PLAN|nr:hypothetical protein Pan241w_41260 [Gimesia alba]